MCVYKYEHGLSRVKARRWIIQEVRCEAGQLLPCLQLLSDSNTWLRALRLQPPLSSQISFYPGSGCVLSREPIVLPTDLKLSSVERPRLQEEKATSRQVATSTCWSADCWMHRWRCKWEQDLIDTLILTACQAGLMWVGRGKLVANKGE